MVTEDELTALIEASDHCHRVESEFGPGWVRARLVEVHDPATCANATAREEATE